MSAASKAPSGLPRLFAGIPAEGALDLKEHLAIHGELPFARRRERRHAAALIDAVEQSGLVGRGGAAFPSAVKMRAVANARGRAIVVINATEGEPASLKDRTLLLALPHLVIDGGVLAARALGADEVILCACESAGPGLNRVALAIAERQEQGERSPRVTLRTIPEGYVAGQESALINHLNGGPAMPTFTPPMPFERGVRRRPTLVSNAETFAHIALIARHGPQWFAQAGTPGHTGSALVTLSGPVAYPGVYEIEQGASAQSLIDAAGGTLGPVRGALLGGYAGTWLPGQQLSELELSNEYLASYGASLGAGVLVLLSADACPVAEVARIVRWLAKQSSGQCGPCLYGLDAMAHTIEQIAVGAGEEQAGRRLTNLVSLTRRRGACAHPDGTVRFTQSALETFSEEFADHAHHGSCDACARAPELPLPSGQKRRRALVTA